MIPSLRKIGVRLAGLAGLAVFPSYCRICRSLLENSGDKVICGECWEKVRPGSPPFCICCGRFYEGAGESHLCGKCLEEPPPFVRHRSFGRYEGTLKEIILLFKYGGYSVLGRKLAGMAWTALAEDEGLWGNLDLVLPVPLHPRRERQRGYNQSHLLAAGLAEGAGVVLAAGVLVKVRPTPPQMSLAARDREVNACGAYSVRASERIRGRTLLLIDDVATTGSTLKECASVLRKAGAAEVRAVTIARA